MEDFLVRVREDLQSPRRVGQVAEATGIPSKTLYNIKYGETENPRYDTVEKLRAFYAIEEANRRMEALQSASQQTAGSVRRGQMNG